MNKKPEDLLDIIYTHQKWLARSVISLSIISALLIIACIIISNKPPKVVQIDGCGNKILSEDLNQNYHDNWTDKAKEFSKVFLDNYLGLRSNHVSLQLKNSLEMMSEDLAKSEFEYISKNNLAKKIELQKSRHDVDIDKIEINDEGDELFLHIRGTLLRKPLSKLNTILERKTFKMDLVLEKIKSSTKYPFGLILKEKHLEYHEKL